MKTRLHPQFLGRSSVCRHWWRQRRFYGTGSDGRHVYVCDPCAQAESPRVRWKCPTPGCGAVAWAAHASDPPPRCFECPIPARHQADLNNGVQMVRA
jgi:hypothetical protein